MNDIIAYIVLAFAIVVVIYVPVWQIKQNKKK